MNNIGNEIFWSNCVIEALKRKFRNWNDIVLIPLFRFPWHFHMMWFDKKSNQVKHFTHKYLPGRASDMFFKGQVECMSIDRLNDWLISVGKEKLIGKKLGEIENED